MPGTNFNHGVEVALVNDQAPPVRTVKTSIIGMVGTAGKGAVLTPKLFAGNRRAVYDEFGTYAGDGQGFTIPEGAAGMFEQGGVTVVFINVCDPATHVTAIVGEEIALNSVTGKGYTAKPYHTTTLNITKIGATVPIAQPARTWTVPTGVTITKVSLTKGGAAIASGPGSGEYSISGGVLTLGTIYSATTSIYIEYTATLVKDTDYTVDQETGLITRISASTKLLIGAELTLNYSYVDPTKVVEADVLEGIALLSTVAATVRAKPRILMAPRFDQTASVSTANAVLSALNTQAKIMGARVLGGCPETTKEAAAIHASFFGGDEDRVSVHFPMHIVSLPNGTEGSVPAQYRWAGLRAVLDNDSGFWVSESNHTLRGILRNSLPLSHGTDAAGSGGIETDTNYLNERGVTTTVFDDAVAIGRGSSFKLWGNRQANQTFLSVQRTADMVNESIMLATRHAVDRNITRGLIAYVLEEVRSYLRSLEARGAILPNPNPERVEDVWADPDLNTEATVALGELYIDYRFNPPSPAERIVFQAHLTTDYISAVFTRDLASA